MEIKEINELLNLLETAFVNGKTQEVLQVLVPFQQQQSLCFSVEQLGLLRLTKKSCLDLADTYSNFGLCKQAKIIYEFVLKYFPEDNELHGKYTSTLLNCAEESIQNSQLAEAREMLFEIIKKDENNIPAMIDLGVIDVIEQKYKDAKLVFQKVLEIEPDNEVARENFQYVIESIRDK